eukprot:1158674-Pelagomonas_calceolata.AAC.4
MASISTMHSNVHLYGTAHWAAEEDMLSGGGHETAPQQCTEACKALCRNKAAFLPAKWNEWLEIA